MEQMERERRGESAFDSVRRFAREHPMAAIAAASSVVAALGASAAARRAASGGGGRVGEIAREMAQTGRDLTRTGRALTRSTMEEVSQRMKRGAGSTPRLGYYRGASMVGKGPQLP
jgi:hypothetical protein